MSRAHFSQVRNTMHTYSRAPIAEGQEFIDQAVARKDSDAGRDWGQEEKGTTEDEMAGWHR